MTAPVGSKANPSKYDAYPNLADDEPYFVIRAHDLLSSALVELHAYIGAGQSGWARWDDAEPVVTLPLVEHAVELGRDLRKLARARLLGADDGVGCIAHAFTPFRFCCLTEACGAPGSVAFLRNRRRLVRS